MENSSQSKTPLIRFCYDDNGRSVVVERGQQVVYKGSFDQTKVEEAVRQLGLSQQDRASLYLNAADFSQDDDTTEILKGLALKYAVNANSIDSLRQQYNIPLTPIGSANY